MYIPGQISSNSKWMKGPKTFLSRMPGSFYNQGRLHDFIGGGGHIRTFSFFGCPPGGGRYVQLRG